MSNPFQQHPGFNDGAIDWQPTTEAQQKGVALTREARAPESDLMISAHVAISAAFEARGEAPVLTVEAKVVDPDSEAILDIDADQRAMRHAAVVDLTEVA